MNIKTTSWKEKEIWEGKIDLGFFLDCGAL